MAQRSSAECPSSRGISLLTRDGAPLPYHPPLCPTSYRVELYFGKTFFVRQRGLVSLGLAARLGGHRSLFEIRRLRTPVPELGDITQGRSKTVPLSPTGRI